MEAGEAPPVGANVRSLYSRLQECVELSQRKRAARAICEPSSLLRYLVFRLSRRFSDGLRVRARLFTGDTLDVFVPEPVSTEVYVNHYTEAPVAFGLLRALKPGMRFFDVGAHFGSHSLLASRLAGPEGLVCAFEPTPSTYSVLHHNLASRSNVRLFEAAVGGRAGSVEMKDFGRLRSAFNTSSRARVLGSWEPDRTYVATVVTLDSIAREHGDPDVLKIDAEGAEELVLDGMREILGRTRPTILMELGDVGADAPGRSRGLIQRILEFGYGAYEHAGAGEFRPHEIKDQYIYENLLFSASTP